MLVIFQMPRGEKINLRHCEGLMLLKPGHFSHLMQRADHWKDLMLASMIDGRRRRGVIEDEMIDGII